MEMIELNSGSDKTALLVHPMLGNSDMIEKLLASRLGSGYRFFIPDLAGHGRSREYPFTEAAREADEIHSYLQRNMVFHLDLVWGAGIGASVALDYMRYVDADFSTMILDGTPFVKAPSFLVNMKAERLVKAHRRAVEDIAGMRKIMMEKYGESGIMLADELEAIDEESLRYMVRSAYEAKYPYLNEVQQKNTHFIYGEKDGNLKTASRRIPDIYPKAGMKILPGLSALEKLMKDPDGYVEILRLFIG